MGTRRSPGPRDSHRRSARRNQSSPAFSRVSSVPFVISSTFFPCAEASAAISVSDGCTRGSPMPPKKTVRVFRRTGSSIRRANAAGSRSPKRSPTQLCRKHILHRRLQREEASTYSFWIWSSMLPTVKTGSPVPCPEGPPYTGGRSPAAVRSEAWCREPPASRRRTAA